MKRTTVLLLNPDQKLTDLKNIPASNGEYVISGDKSKLTLCLPPYNLTCDWDIDPEQTEYEDHNLIDTTLKIVTCRDTFSFGDYAFTYDYVRNLVLSGELTNKTNFYIPWSRAHSIEFIYNPETNAFTYVRKSHPNFHLDN